MKVHLYSHLIDSPGNRLITAEAESRGHQVTLVRPSEVELALTSEKSPNPALIFTRVGSSAPSSALAKLNCLVLRGHRVLNKPEALYKSRDKTLTYALLAHAGVPIPKTLLLGSTVSAEQLGQLVGPPWIVKNPIGTKGQGVCIVESERSLRSVIEVMRQDSDSLLLQEFIEEAAGTDTRVVVLGGKATVAATRTAQNKDEFRSNVHLGGKANTIEITPEISEIAEQATKVLGLDIAGVDLLKTKDGYLVVEVNGSPGLTASPNLPAAVVDYLETQSL